MKIMFIAAALSLSLSSAYAGETEGIQPYTYFQQLPGVIAQAAPVQAPVVATAQNGQLHVFVAQSGRGTWLFQGNQNHEGANS